MQNTTGNTYTANIPGLNDSNDVAYYIYAENDNSKTESHPRIGVSDPHLFSYSGGSIGIDDLANNNDVSIYPNPSNSIVTLQTTLLSGTISVCNTNGQQVYYTNFNEPSTRIDIRDFTSGIYFVKITSDNASFTKKLIVE